MFFLKKSPIFEAGAALPLYIHIEEHMTNKKEMQLGDEELKEIGSYVQTHLSEWIEHTDFVKKDSETRESLFRLETELKSQRELHGQNMRLMEKRFDQVDKRFEEILHYMDKRFEQVDKRFEEILHYMDKRFEQVEKRFDQVDKRFEQVDKRFEQVEKRFDQVDKRFDQVDKRFESSDRRFASVEQRLISIEKSLRTFIYSSFSFTAAAAGVVIAVLKFT